MNRYESFLTGRMTAGRLVRLTDRDRISLTDVIHGFEDAHQKILANPVAAPPRTEKDVKALLKSVVKETAAMSAEEVAASIQRAGIFTRSGKLSRKYGGRG